jgi:hypothetical protein
MNRFALKEAGGLPSNAELDSGNRKKEAKLRAFWLPDCTMSCEPDYKTDKQLDAPNAKTQCPEVRSLSFLPLFNSYSFLGPSAQDHPTSPGQVY